MLERIMVGKSIFPRGPTNLDIQHFNSRENDAIIWVIKMYYLKILIHIDLPVSPNLGGVIYAKE